MVLPLSDTRGILKLASLRPTPKVSQLSSVTEGLLHPENLPGDVVTKRQRLDIRQNTPLILKVK